MSSGNRRLSSDHFDETLQQVESNESPTYFPHPAPFGGNPLGSMWGLAPLIYEEPRFERLTSSPNEEVDQNNPDEAISREESRVSASPFHPDQEKHERVHNEMHVHPGEEKSSGLASKDNDVNGSELEPFIVEAQPVFPGTAESNLIEPETLEKDTFFFKNETTTVKVTTTVKSSSSDSQGQDDKKKDSSTALPTPEIVEAAERTRNDLLRNKSKDKVITRLRASKVDNSNDSKQDESSSKPITKHTFSFKSADSSAASEGSAQGQPATRQGKNINVDAKVPEEPTIEKPKLEKEDDLKKKLAKELAKLYQKELRTRKNQLEAKDTASGAGFSKSGEPVTIRPLRAHPVSPTPFTRHRGTAARIQSDKNAGPKTVRQGKTIGSDDNGEPVTEAPLWTTTTLSPRIQSQQRLQQQSRTKTEIDDGKRRKRLQNLIVPRGRYRSSGQEEHTKDQTRAVTQKTAQSPPILGPSRNTIEVKITRQEEKSESEDGSEGQLGEKRCRKVRKGTIVCRVPKRKLGPSRPDGSNVESSEEHRPAPPFGPPIHNEELLKTIHGAHPVHIPVQVDPVPQVHIPASPFFVHGQPQHIPEPPGGNFANTIFSAEEDPPPANILPTIDLPPPTEFFGHHGHDVHRPEGHLPTHGSHHGHIEFSGHGFGLKEEHQHQPIQHEPPHRHPQPQQRPTEEHPRPPGQLSFDGWEPLPTPVVVIQHETEQPHQHVSHPHPNTEHQRPQTHHVLRPQRPPSSHPRGPHRHKVFPSQRPSQEHESTPNNLNGFHQEVIQRPHPHPPQPQRPPPHVPFHVSPRPSQDSGEDVRHFHFQGHKQRPAPIGPPPPPTNSAETPYAHARPSRPYHLPEQASFEEDSTTPADLLTPVKEFVQKTPPGGIQPTPDTYYTIPGKDNNLVHAIHAGQSKDADYENYVQAPRPRPPKQKINHRPEEHNEDEEQNVGHVSGKPVTQLSIHGQGYTTNYVEPLVVYYEEQSEQGKGGKQHESPYFRPEITQVGVDLSVNRPGQSGHHGQHGLRRPQHPNPTLPPQDYYPSSTLQPPPYLDPSRPHHQTHQHPSPPSEGHVQYQRPQHIGLRPTLNYIGRPHESEFVEQHSSGEQGQYLTPVPEGYTQDNQLPAGPPQASPYSKEVLTPVAHVRPHGTDKPHDEEGSEYDGQQVSSAERPLYPEPSTPRPPLWSRPSEIDPPTRPHYVKFTPADAHSSQVHQHSAQRPRPGLQRPGNQGQHHPSNQRPHSNFVQPFGVQEQPSLRGLGGRYLNRPGQRPIAESTTIYSPEGAHGYQSERPPLALPQNYVPPKHFTLPAAVPTRPPLSENEGGPGYIRIPIDQGPGHTPRYYPRPTGPSRPPGYLGNTQETHHSDGSYSEEDDNTEQRPRPSSRPPFIPRPEPEQSERPPPPTEEPGGSSRPHFPQSRPSVNLQHFNQDRPTVPQRPEHPYRLPTSDSRPLHLPQRPPHERPPHDRPPHERPPHDRPPHERPPHERPRQERPSHVKPPHERPPHKRPPQERPPQERPPYERPPHERPEMHSSNNGFRPHLIGPKDAFGSNQRPPRPENTRPWQPTQNSRPAAEDSFSGIQNQFEKVIQSAYQQNIRPLQGYHQGQQSHSVPEGNSLIASVTVPRYQVTPRPTPIHPPHQTEKQPGYIRPTTYRPSTRNLPMISPTPQPNTAGPGTTPPRLRYNQDQRELFGGKLNERYKSGQRAPRPTPVPTPVHPKGVRTDSGEVPFLGIPGIPGKDYPLLGDVPGTSFSCNNHEYPGYYADVDTRCQAFHFCYAPHKTAQSFLCPNGTLFNQKYFVCDWWYNVQCGDAHSHYARNADLFLPFEPPGPVSIYVHSESFPRLVGTNAGVYLEAQLNENEPAGGYSLEKFGSYGTRLNKNQHTNDIYGGDQNQRLSRGASGKVSSNHQQQRAEEPTENVWLLTKDQQAQIVKVKHPFESSTEVTTTQPSSSPSGEKESTSTFKSAEIHPK